MNEENVQPLEIGLFLSSFHWLLWMMATCNSRRSIVFDREQLLQHLFCGYGLKAGRGNNER